MDIVLDELETGDGGVGVEEEVREEGVTLVSILMTYSFVY